MRQVPQSCHIANSLPIHFIAESRCQVGALSYVDGGGGGLYFQARRLARSLSWALFFIYYFSIHSRGAVHASLRWPAAANLQQLALLRPVPGDVGMPLRDPADSAASIHARGGPRGGPAQTPPRDPRLNFQGPKKKTQKNRQPPTACHKQGGLPGAPRHHPRAQTPFFFFFFFFFLYGYIHPGLKAVERGRTKNWLHTIHGQIADCRFRRR